MKHTLLFVGIAVSATACKLLPIPGFGETTTKTTAAPSEAVANGDPGALGKLEEGHAPPWCDGYTPAAGDHHVLSVELPVTERMFGSMARAACDKPGDPARERQVTEWRKSFAQTYATTTDADFVAAMTLSMLDVGALREAQCEAVKALDVSEARRRVIEGIVGCGDLAGLEDSLAELDPSTPGPLDTLAVVASCFRSDESIGSIGACWHDATRLDRPSFDAALERVAPNLYGRVSAVLAFGAMKKRTDTIVAKVTTLAKKDPAWKQIVDAHEAGYASWVEQRARHSKIFDAVAAFDAKAATGSKKAAAGCSKGLYEHYTQYMGPKLTTKEEVTARANDPVGRPLSVALMHCLALEGSPYAFIMRHHLLDPGNGIWGPRDAALVAATRALAEVKEDQPNFDLSFGNWSDAPQRQHDAEQATDQASREGSGLSSSGKGEVAKLTPLDENRVRIDFKKVKWKEPIEECTPTNKVKAIEEDGSLVYFSHCVVTGSRTKESSLAPIVVPAVLASVIKPGNLVFEYGTISVEYEQPEVPGFPVEVYASAKSSKLVAYMGVKLGK